MHLTGKCKEDFLKQFCGTFPSDELLQSAYIIEWFDSVSIYIWIIPSLRVVNKWTYRIFNSNLLSNVNQVAYLYKSRQEATKKAIEYANEEYNDRNL